MVETRFSAAVPPLKEEESETQLTARVLAFLFRAWTRWTVVSFVLDALSHGAGSADRAGPWR